MSIVTSTNFFRYSKPTIPDIELVLELPKEPYPISYNDTDFSDSISGVVNGSFDILQLSNFVSNPPTLDGNRDYEFVNGTVKMKKRGYYTLRVYDDIMPFSAGLIEIQRYLTKEAKSGLGLGVPFYPEILSRTRRGYATIANDRINISYTPRITGLDDFSYRLVNIYGQATEPACVFITIVDDLEAYYLELEEKRKAEEEEREKEEEESEEPVEEPDEDEEGEVVPPPVIEP